MALSGQGADRLNLDDCYGPVEAALSHQQTDSRVDSPLADIISVREYKSQANI